MKGVFMVYVTMRQVAMSLPVFILLWAGLSVPHELPMQPKKVTQATDEQIAPAKSKPATMIKARQAATGEVVAEYLCPGQSGMSNIDSDLVCLTNEARRVHGLPALYANGDLMEAAAAKGDDLRACGFSHNACGRDFNYWTRQGNYGGRCSGENIAWNQRSAREVFTAWMNSPSHRANILDAGFRDIGVNVTPSSNGPLWTMVLGGC